MGTLFDQRQYLVLDRADNAPPKRVVLSHAPVHGAVAGGQAGGARLQQLPACTRAQPVVPPCYC
jgi:hypothetical protein